MEVVATCASRCVVTAHPACFVRRRAATIFRKKHHDRSNGAPELCLSAGCTSRVRACRGPRDAECASKRDRVDAKTTAVECSPCCDDPCSFLRRDGTPCQRPAVRDGACRLHLRDADVMRRMMDDNERCVARSPRRKVRPRLHQRLRPRFHQRLRQRLHSRLRPRLHPRLRPRLHPRWHPRWHPRLHQGS